MASQQQKVLVVGSGGREHCLAWKLAQSPHVGQIFIAPGNGGTARLGQNIPIPDSNITSLKRFALESDIDLTVVGPEAPLAAGIVDEFNMAGLRAFGPSKIAARLEASKAFAKNFMIEAGIPTAAYGAFQDYDQALTYLDGSEWPDGVVIKASGLAAGKGVIICDTAEEAREAVHGMMVARDFGEAGAEVVIEERLTGPEVSVLCFSDGKSVVPMLPARDHKRAYDGDQGPNTGGMGAYAPPPDLAPSFVTDITATILQPVVEKFTAAGTPYIGVLYAGLMLTPTGPKVLEFNCRFGDPETQVILPLLQADLYEIMQSCLDGTLSPVQVRIAEGACATVVMAAPGYPGKYPKGLEVQGDDAVQEALVFHAGTAESGGRLCTNGGRVLAVTALGDDVQQAVEKAYAGVEQIHFEGAHYRTDIGRAP